MNNIYKERRFGKFFISLYDIENCTDSVKEFLNNTLILEADYSFFRDGIVYLGLCDLFDPVPKGELLKNMKLIFTQNII